MAAPTKSSEYEFEWSPYPAVAATSSVSSITRERRPTRTIENLSPPLIAMFAVVATAFLIVFYARILSQQIRRLRRRWRRWRRRRRLLRYAPSADSDFGSRSPSPPPVHPAYVAGDAYSDYLFYPYGLDDAAIKSLPLSLFSKTKAKQPATTNRECAVCLYEFEDGEWLRTLPFCSHVFHVECIDVWLRSHASCPICRTDVSFRNDSPFVPMRAARIRRSFDDIVLCPPPPLPPGPEIAPSPQPDPIPEEPTRNFLLKRSYSFGFERSEPAERLVMEAATASPPWRHRHQHSHLPQRGFWSKRWPSPFGGGGSSSASRSSRGFSFRSHYLRGAGGMGMKSPFMRRWGFIPLTGGNIGGMGTLVPSTAGRRSRSMTSPSSAMWMARPLVGFSSSRLRCGDPEALLSPERLNHR
ncbi:hypothetical protein HPP92_022023 [Vanilla planifolia]|uniref:RING-type E3 ubiquitin transferase n=1 Tax=Vanilla planifolia TaxID=51239 RepID=A0A835UJJ8_VANPL|nr:hypothetical protein HPP92_022018 [Vanilla planifolia]KAG0461726.1 hypothetical protein HPP92_022023 [Vanilla planifolia]